MPDEVSWMEWTGLESRRSDRVVRPGAPPTSFNFFCASFHGVKPGILFWFSPVRLPNRNKTSKRKYCLPSYKNMKLSTANKSASSSKVG